jgi:hypothetical protein
MSTVSVVMTPYNRGLLLRNTFQTYQWQTRKPDQIVVVEDGFDGGRTMEVCAEAREWGLPVEYFCRRNRPNIPYSNSAIPRNIGIKKATGEILVMQNGEVRFTKATDFANIVGPTEENEWISCVAPCRAFQEDGSYGIWLCDPTLWNYNHFCQAFRRDHLIKIGGFDQTFKGYGREDHDFNWRLYLLGVVFQWAEDVVTEHQWHPVMPSPQDAENDAFNYEYGGKQMEDYKNGLRGIESNLGIDWGNPND